MQDDIHKSIDKTRTCFEKSFEAGSYYDKQTQDKHHLQRILSFLNIHPTMKILDLGTGTGYLSFPLAKKYPEANIIGLDIVEKTLEKNQKKAICSNLTNLQFISYDGTLFPFADESFDMVVTRYALHHFPAIEATFHEIARVLKPEGSLFLADPAPNHDDEERFVDAYMQMKKDGHIKFYTKQEWQEITALTGLNYIDGFETSIRFPKKIQNTIAYNHLIEKYDKTILQGYALEIIDDEVWITEKVNNLLFQKI